MQLNINTVKTVLNKVNSKGASLIRKETGLDASMAAKEGFKLQLPETAHTCDIVRIGRNNNPALHYTDVLTFRDKSGQIVNRYIKQVDGKNIKETHKGYEEMFPWEKDMDESGKEVMDIFGKKVRSYTRENGKIKQIQEDTFAVSDEPKPYLTHFQRTITPAAQPRTTRVNNENILLEQRRSGEKPKFLQNEYKVDDYYTGDFYLINSRASSGELKKIAQNSYFLPYVSPTPKFTNRMANACIEDANFIAPPEIKLYKEASAKSGFYTGDVNINLKSSRDLSAPRESLTETIGHEVSHAKWAEKTLMYDMHKNGIDMGNDFKKFIKPGDIPKIEKYKYSSEHYISPKEDYKGYLNQYCERVAREDGTAAVRKYSTLDKAIKNEFPYRHEFQFYQPNYNQDDLMGLASLLKAWK